MITKLAKITNVWTHVNFHVDLELIVKLPIMWLFAGVLEALLEIHSRVVEDSPRMKFVKLVEPILIVKLDKMTDPFAGVRKITLAIL